VNFTAGAYEAAAKAIARAADADYWVDEVAGWEMQEEWEREAYPEEYPAMAYEDRANFMKQAYAALTAAKPFTQEAPDAS